MKNAIWMSLALASMSCGGGAASTGDETTEATTGDESTTAARTSITHDEWEAMDDAARGQYMADVVVPTMRPLFAQFDGERFAEFNCATCHGDNAQEVGFHMPNGLAPLDPSQIPAMQQSEDPMHVFMTQTVWPQMGALVGQELYEAETQSGFSCMHCHAYAP